MQGELIDINMIPILVGSILMLARTWMDVFILTVNGRDWMKKKHLSTTDRILTLQGSIRICMGCTEIIWLILKKFCPWITRIRFVFKAFMFILWYLTSCNVWLTTSLCSYYCVKIADFSHPFFVHLKLRLSGLVSAWLLGSAVLSLANALLLAYIDLEIQDNSNFSNFSQNKDVTDISHTWMTFQMDWMEKKRLSATDRILTSQGAIRICLGCLELIRSIMEKCCPWITRIGYVHKAFMFIMWYLQSCNVWLTTSLCSYYCVKIADFSHPFFVHLKLRLSGLVSTWLLSSAILSLAGTLPLAYFSWEIQDNSNFSNFSQNKDVTDISHTWMVFHMGGNP
ncbi:UNVERIFIED_CONTAM: hypothetical protein K2H54_041539 [Gekko kuhli]